ncbi:hypothetical protein BN132_2435 [Cronobacter turicensis 564]|nr:hypothetical protein BN132_2435 [Cronobacter turicensis 564]
MSLRHYPLAVRSWRQRFFIPARRLAKFKFHTAAQFLGL